MLHIPSLYIGSSGLSGRGVYTSVPIEAGGMIEISPVIVLSSSDLKLVHQTFLHDYYFLWGKKEGAIALGYGSLYNHAADPNADYRMDYSNQSINFFCIRSIRAGEEITINYVDGEQEKGGLWFKDAGQKG